MSIIGAVAIAFIATVSIATLYHAPSCSDSVQNQGEAGIDCGGPCAYLCTAQVQPPTVLFTKAIVSGAGRVDVIASVENKNATAGAKNVPYTVSLYGTGKAAVEQVTGTVDLPPGATIPLYIPGVALNGQKVIRAFLEIDPSVPRWFSTVGMVFIRPVVSNTTIGGTSSAPRIDSVLTNASTAILTNVPAIIFVRDAQGDVIAASKTIVPTIPAQGQAVATFTWNTAFSAAPTAIEVVPVISLP